MKDWHTSEVAHVAEHLGTDEGKGLSEEEAARRLAVHGRNELASGSARSPVAVVVDQLRSLVTWVLIAAGAISILLGEILDGAAILSIVVLNSVIGAAKELRAERAVRALTQLTAPKARVLRSGASRVVPAHDVVPGDVLILDAGDLVAADARLAVAAALRTNEAPLTGESEPVEKIIEPLPPETLVADRHNLVFLGTSVVGGSGRALAVATGMRTEVGRIARLTDTAAGGRTPLQRRLDTVGRQLLGVCLGIVVVVFTVGLLRGVPLFELFLGSVSLAVAAVPEGLPAVVTIALALGVERMARRRALARSLSAVETLGATQVICTDKTGTLTVGAMTARTVATPDAICQVTGEGYATEGRILREDGSDAAGDVAVQRLLRAAAACNDAELIALGGVATIAGDPTEAALLVAAAKAGLTRETIEVEEPRLRTLPFDPVRKCMSVVRLRGGESFAYVKGAPEAVLERCTQIARGAESAPCDAAALASVGATCTSLAAAGLRVLALAERKLRHAGEEPVEAELTFLGVLGLQDPPRPAAREAVAQCRAAGIRTVMITGDHHETARAIARELGILGPADELVIGSELQGIDDGALAKRVDRISVYARVSPEDKLRIVRAWKARGFVVAMTGDGVNDAPALREASIGIAMGSGTEVAKQASDLVIADDDFASIVAAVEQGRGIFDNVRKTLAYLLAGNTGELMLVLGAMLAGYPLPLLPVQLLWINLVTDGLPALALATDPIDSDVLARPPERSEAALADRSRLGGIFLTGFLTAACAFLAFAFTLSGGGDLAAARGAAFSTLVFAELIRAFGARSERRFVTEIGLLSNLRLFAVVSACLLLQLGLHHSPAAGRVFGIVPASPLESATWLLLGCLPLLVLEARKAWRRRASAGKLER